MLDRLKERKLVQWAGAYLAGAWLLFQVAGELRDTFNWPPTIVRVLAVLLGIGFLATVVLAWYHGEKGQQRVSGPELLLLLALLVIAGGVVSTAGGRVGSPIGSVASLAGAATGAGRAAPSTSADRSLAVLPFVNLSRDPENAYFSDGITEEIRMTLGNLVKVDVVSGQSVMRYRDSNKPVREIGSELGATHVITGSVQRAGSQVRIIAQLVDAATDRQLWADRYDRPAADVLSVQSAIAREIARALEAEFTPMEQARLQRNSTESLTAYEYVLKGREYWGRLQPNDNEVALSFFRKAIEIDSLYSDAYAGLSSALRMYLVFRVGSAARMDSSVVAARRAVDLDPTSARAHSELGWALDYQNDPTGALAAHHRAIELNPSFAGMAAPGMANVYQYGLHRFDEAARWWKLALETEPNVVAWHMLAGRTYRELGMFEPARQHLERAIALQPDLIYLYEDLSAVLALEGKNQQARAQIGRMLAAMGEDRRTINRALLMALLLRDTTAAEQYYDRYVSMGEKPWPVVEAQMLMLRGETARSRQVAFNDALKRQKQQQERDPGLRGGSELAKRWVLAGQRDRAIGELERITRDGWRIYHYTMIDPVLSSLRGDPRFDRLMGRVRAEVERQRVRVERERW